MRKTKAHGGLTYGPLEDVSDLPGTSPSSSEPVATGVGRRDSGSSSRIFERKSLRVALILAVSVLVVVVLGATRLGAGSGDGDTSSTPHDSSLDLVSEESLPENIDEIIEAVLEEQSLLDIRTEEDDEAYRSVRPAESEDLERSEKDSTAENSGRSKSDIPKQQHKVHIPSTKKKLSKGRKEELKKALENDPLGLKDTPLTRAQWLKLQEYENEVAEEQEDLQRRMDAYDSLLTKGDWYWSKSRHFVKSKSQSFWTQNATADSAKANKYKRAVDFHQPLKGKWVYEKENLPLYWGGYPGTPTDKCFSKRESLRKVLHTRSSNRKKDHFVVFRDYDCKDATGCSRLRFKPSQCSLLRLFDVRVAATLRKRRVFFIGDYSMKQQYESLKCVLAPLMWPKMKRLGAKKGSRTGLKGEAYTIFNHETEIHCVYAGFYRLKEGKKRGKRGGEMDLDDLGLGSELREAAKAAHAKSSGERGGDLSLMTDDLADHGIYEIGDVLRERGGHFRPTDIVVANIGNDYSDDRVYKQSLLRFMRAYEDLKQGDGGARAPLVLWRETAAQHHGSHFGGDILRPRSAHNAQGQPQASPLGRTIEEKSEIQCASLAHKELAESNWRNDLANKLMESAGIKVLRVWKPSTKKSDWYRGWCKDSDLPESNGAHCERWGPCKHHCSPGAITFFNEVLLTMIESPPVARNLALRQKQWDASGSGTGNATDATADLPPSPKVKAKTYHRELKERMVKVFLSTNEVWPFDRKKPQINPNPEDVKWEKLDPNVGKEDERYWNSKRKEG